MKLLLDTNALLAVLGDVPPLSAKVEQLLNNPSNEKVVSIASFWELAIKVSLNKLWMALSPADVLTFFEQRQTATVLQINATHLEALSKLPQHHRDPFDRLIVAQALNENCSIVSSDGRLDAYGIKRLW